MCTSTAICQGSENFSVMSLIENILDFAGHVVAVTTIQLCHYIVKAAKENPQVSENDYVPVEIFMDTENLISHYHKILFFL